MPSFECRATATLQDMQTAEALSSMMFSFKLEAPSATTSVSKATEYIRARLPDAPAGANWIITTMQIRDADSEEGAFYELTAYPRRM